MEASVAVKLIICRPHDGRLKTVTTSGIPIAGLATVSDALTHAINEHNLNITISDNPMDVPTYTLNGDGFDADWFDEPKPGAEYKLRVFGEWTEEPSQRVRLHGAVLGQLRGRSHKVPGEEPAATEKPADEPAQTVLGEKLPETDEGNPAEPVSAPEAPGEPGKHFEAAPDGGRSEKADHDSSPAGKTHDEEPVDAVDQSHNLGAKPASGEDPEAAKKPKPALAVATEKVAHSDEEKPAEPVSADEPDEPMKPFEPAPDDGRSKQSNEGRSPAAIDDEEPANEADQPQSPGPKPVPKARQLMPSVDDSCKPQSAVKEHFSEPVLKRAVLLLGESGNGKSTFLNCAFNKFAHAIFEAACADPKYVIPSAFEVPQDDTTKPIRVGREDEFERLTVGESGTQHCSIYRFRYRLESGQLCELEIIDTPGINDPQGEIRDNAILQSIVLFLTKRVPELHGICLVFQEGNTRLDTTFGHVIAEYLCRLHRNAAQNLLFCITNCGWKGISTQTRATIEKFLLEKLRDRQGMDISMEGRTFCFEQDFFHYIHAIQRPDIHFDEVEVALYKKSWASWTSTMDALLRTIVDLPAHDLEESIKTYAARTVLINLPATMAEVTKVLCENIECIEKLNKDIAECDLHDARLRDLMYTPELFLEKDGNVRPQTVCTSQKCSKNVGGEKHYRQVCHKDCGANKYVQANKPGDEALRLCSAFKRKGMLWGWKPGDNCLVCGCSYKEHMHIPFTHRVCARKAVDQTIVAKIKDVKSAKQAQQDQLKVNEMRLKELTEEERFITQKGILLACIVEQDAILPVNDFKKAFLERQIKDAELCGRTDQALKLKVELAHYETECELMKQTFDPTKVRPRDIDELKEQLFALERSGKIIRRLYHNMAEAETQMRNTADFVFDAQQAVRGRAD